RGEISICHDVRVCGRREPETSCEREERRGEDVEAPMMKHVDALRVESSGERKVLRGIWAILSDFCRPVVWVRAGMASILDHMPDRRQWRVQFVGNQSGAAICALMTTRSRE